MPQEPAGVADFIREANGRPLDEQLGNQMQSFQIPTQSEQNEFLLRLYFGMASPLRACVDRAYLDFSRTLHGINQLADAAAVRTEAGELVQSWLAKMPALTPDPNQDIFDASHRSLCEQLCALYGRHGFDSFAVGQSQKWLNMALKYVYVFGEERLPGFFYLYRLGHVPLDNIILDRLASLGSPRLSSGAWSRLRHYDEYLGFQHWIREKFPYSAPLAVEFHLWRTGE
ncbi:MAG: hypothetical protein ACHQ9S_24975 [Candidatus Binatia bacterium]